MEPDRKALRQAILTVVETQIEQNDPPETKATLDRLVGEGHSHEEAMKMIGCVVVEEIFEIMRHGKLYDHERYLAALAALPTLPE